MLAKINEPLKMLIDKSNEVSAVLGQFFGLSLDFLGNFFSLKVTSDMIFSDPWEKSPGRKMEEN